MMPTCIIFSTFISLICSKLIDGSSVSQISTGLELGFPEAWTGDSYRNVTCRVNGIPDWLDGYLVALVNGAYGKLGDNDGDKLTHMADGLAALASMQFRDGMVRFSGKYLPTKAYKIWDFYGRQLHQSRVAWPTLRSPFVIPVKEKWDQITADYFPYNPNQAIWKIGTRITAVGESLKLGLQFDVSSLSEFAQMGLQETNDLLAGNTSVQLLTFSTDARTESDGSIYGTIGAVDHRDGRMYQFIYKITAAGVRTLEGAFDYGKYEVSKCGSDQRYAGDKRALAGVARSVVSTEAYLIIPISSAYVNPCKLQEGSDRHRAPSSKLRDDTDDYKTVGSLRYPKTAVEYGNDLPIRFLIFNKRQRRFITDRPLESYPARFISRHINAYELDRGALAIDLISYDSFESFDHSFSLDHILLQSSTYKTRSAPVRFTLDLQRGNAEWSNMVPESVQSMEFPTINGRFFGRRYEYAYVVQPPFTIGNQLGKINTNDHTGGKNIYFSHGPSVVLGEAVFVPSPNARSEDDGVILSLALETLSKRSVLFVIDSRTMREIGRAEMTIAVPFGLHCRYFESKELITSTGRITTDRGDQKRTSDNYRSQNIINSDQRHDRADQGEITDPVGQQLIIDTDRHVSASPTIDSILNKIYPGLINPSGADTADSNDSPDERKPSIIMQRNNAGSVSQILHLPQSTAHTDSTSTLQPSATILKAFHKELWNETSDQRPTVGMIALPPTASSSSEVFGFYLNNGTYVQVFPDGNTKSYPPIPNYATDSSAPTPSQSSPTQRPPYLFADPGYVELVKSQLPAPPVFTTLESQIATTQSILKDSLVWNADAKPVGQDVSVPSEDANTKSTSVSHPRLFPGFRPPWPATTEKSTSIGKMPDNSTYLVINVIVDPNKQIRQPRIMNQSDPNSQWTSPLSTASSTISTKSPGIDYGKSSSFGDEELGNDSLKRFLERSRGLLCRLFGKLITALGSRFCKIDARGRRNEK